MAIVKMEAKYRIKCVGCGEQVRTCEKYLQVQVNGKNVRGERYCTGCERIARLNNPEAEGDATPEDDGESHLRAMEDYAAYRAAGCSQEYWTDRDNGYAN